MRRKHKKRENDWLYNRMVEEEEIPFAVDEDLIKEPDYEEMPETDVPFAMGGNTAEENKDSSLVMDSDVEEESFDSDETEDSFDVDGDAAEESFAMESDDTEESDSSEIEDIDVPFSLDSKEEFLNEEKGNNVKKRRKRRKMKKSKKALIIIVVILSILGVCLGGGYLYVKYYLGSLGISGDNDIYDLMTKVDSSKVEDIEKLDRVNILLLGVDKEGTRSDSIMLVSYNVKTNKINLLSVPRDTRIYVEDRGTYRKITEVHAMHDKNGNMYGASAVAQAVIGLTGMDINYYMEFSFDAIDRIMDELGPVKFDVPDLEGKGRGMNYDDGFQDLHIHLKPGMQELNGNQIQQFLRYRKSNYKDAQNVFGSDLERVERQQALLGAIIDQKLNAGIIMKAPKLLETVRSSIKTTFTGDELLTYAQFLTKDSRYASISSENMESFVLPGGSQMISGKSYFICDEAETAKMLRINFGVDVQEKDITNAINIGERKTAGKISVSKKKSETTKETSSNVVVKKKEQDEEKKKNQTQVETETKNNTSRNNVVSEPKEKVNVTEDRTTENNSNTVVQRVESEEENTVRENGTNNSDSTQESNVSSTASSSDTSQTSGVSSAVSSDNVESSADGE